MNNIFNFVLCKASDVSWSLVKYNQQEEDLVYSDLEQATSDNQSPRDSVNIFTQLSAGLNLKTHIKNIQ